MEKQIKQAARKSPHRDPVRKLLTEKARLEFEIRALSDKWASEESRHRDIAASLEKARIEKADRILAINAEPSSDSV